MGFAKLKELVDSYKWDKAMVRCMAQCEDHADILVFNIDSDLLDGEPAMGWFMKMCVAEPTAARSAFRLITLLGVKQIASGFEKMNCDTAGTFQDGVKSIISPCVRP